MKKVYKILIAIVVLVSFYSCAKEHKISTKIKLNKIAKVFNDSLLVCSTLNDSVVIENIKNGKIIFSKKINDIEAIRPQPVLSKNNYLYAVFFENKLSCIDIKTNTVKWNYVANEKINVIKSVNDSIVIIGIRDFGLVALNSRTGKIIYKLSDNEASNCPTTFVLDFVYDDKNIYVSDFQCNTITAFNLSNGEKKWSYGFDNYGPCKAIIYGDLIFCGTTGQPNNNQGRIFMLNKNTGRLVFEDTTNQFDITTIPILYKDKVIYSTYDGKLVIFDLKNTKSELLSDFSAINGLCGGQLHLINNYIYLDVCGNDIYGIDLKTKTFNRIGKVRKGLNEVYLYRNQVRFVY